MTSLPRGACLPNEACRTALRIRLGLPLFQAALACQYTPATTQRPCGHPLDVHGQHAANCSSGHVRARHDWIKHTWAQLLHLAGWHVPVEQAISLSTSSASSSIPLVHHFTGMLGLTAFDVANFIMRDIATKSAVVDGAPWQMAVGKSRGLIFQQLTYAHMRSHYRVYRACEDTFRGG
eukprot:4605125-Amphidinium_carterae.1